MSPRTSTLLSGHRPASRALQPALLQPRWVTSDEQTPGVFRERLTTSRCRAGNLQLAERGVLLIRPFRLAPEGPRRAAVCFIWQRRTVGAAGPELGSLADRNAQAWSAQRCALGRRWCVRQLAGSGLEIGRVRTRARSRSTMTIAPRTSTSLWLESARRSSAT
jgi:hypothetical protein